MGHRKEKKFFCALGEIYWWERNWKKIKAWKILENKMANLSALEDGENLIFLDFRYRLFHSRKICIQLPNQLYPFSYSIFSWIAFLFWKRASSFGLSDSIRVKPTDWRMLCGQKLEPFICPYSKMKKMLQNNRKGKDGRKTLWLISRMFGLQIYSSRKNGSLKYCNWSWE